MPDYTKLPTAVQTDLEKRVGLNINIQIVIDPFTDNPKQIGGRYSVKDMSPIIKNTNVDLKTSVIMNSDLRIQFNDIDGYFDPSNDNSYFHQFSEYLDRDHSAGDQYVYTEYSDSILSAGQTLYLKGYAISDTGAAWNEEEVTVVESAMTGGGVKTKTSVLTKSYDSGSFAFTRKIENVETLVRFVACDGTQISLYVGQMNKLPEWVDGTARITLIDPTKVNDDIRIAGADSADATKLKVFLDGSLADSSIVTSSAGTFDISNVYVRDDSFLSKWELKFESATNYNLKGPGIAIDRNIDYGFVKYFQDAGNNFSRGDFGVLNGNYIYCVSSSDFIVIDISTPGSPSVVGEGDYQVGLVPQHLSYNDGYIYIISQGLFGDSRITVFDVSTPSSPTRVEEYTETDAGISFSPNRCLADGNYLYVTAYNQFLIFDISTPSSISNVTSIPKATIENTFAIDKSGDYVYVSSGVYNAGPYYLTIIDVSTPSSPVITGKVQTIYNVYDIDIDGTDCFMVADEGYLIVANVTSKTNPSISHNQYYGGSPENINGSQNILISGDYVFIGALRSNAMSVFDISTPGSPSFMESIECTAAPYYFDEITTIQKSGEYLFVLNTSGLTVLRIDYANYLIGFGNNFDIGVDAFGGTFADGDTVSFCTAYNLQNLNVAQAVYNILTDKAEINSRRINSSSYFGDIEVGVLGAAISAGSDVDVDVSIKFPTLLKAGETLIIDDGSTQEEVEIGTGNTVNTQYPPTITITINSLTNNFAADSTVTWKQRGSVDTDFNFDDFYDYFDTSSMNVKLSLSHKMSINQAIASIAWHGLSKVYTDNWGIYKFFSIYRNYSTSGLPEITGTTNLCSPNPQKISIQLVNSFHCNYGYDYTKLANYGKNIYPKHDRLNISYQQHGIKCEQEILFPGYWDDDLVETLLTVLYEKHKNGLEMFRFHCSLQLIIGTIGDIFELTSLFPAFTKNVLICNIPGFSLLPNVRKTFDGLVI